MIDHRILKDLLTAHGLLTAGLIREPGRFPSGDAGVSDGDHAVHLGARTD